MEQLLIDYRLDRPTWFYLSLLLILAVYFRFSRPVSLRNVDLLLLLSLSPGLLLVEAGSRAGYVWLFASTAAILVRLLTDGLFSRRPRVPQNLNTAGLTFLMVVCALFHTAGTLTADRVPASAVQTARRAAGLVQRRDVSAFTIRRGDEPPAGPAAAVLTAPAIGLSRAVSGEGPAGHEPFAVLAARIAAVLAHAAVIGGLVTLGWRLFGDVQLGVGMATLYLLLPCTAYNVAQLNHVLPAALILWAVNLYRNPFAAGGLLGLACGTLLFPVFLLPVWMTYYGRRNALRFAAAVGAVWAGLLVSMTFTASDGGSFTRQLVALADGSLLRPEGIEIAGLWAGVDGVYRIPVFALFVVMTGLLCLWPQGRTLERLLARSGAVVAGTQFWYPHEGGTYLLWFVPLLLAVAFRPALPHTLPPTPAAWPWRRRRVKPSATRPVAAARVVPRPLFR